MAELATPRLRLTIMDYRLRQRRRRNYNIPGHAHALTFSVYKRYQFLRAERTCEWLAEAIEEARKTLDFALWAFVFMPEHAHLVVWPRRHVYDIADIRSAIKEPVGRKAMAHLQLRSPEWLARVTRRRGKRLERLFWQSGGGFDENIDDPRALREIIEYIHLNPVNCNLTESARDWKWSSAGWYEGQPTCSLHPDPIPVEWCW